jgi:DNA-binding PadR family transcriptional regulator
MTGYQVRKAIDQVLGHFWHESFGQIYPALADLEARGLVRRRASERSSQFEITPAGRDELRARLREQPEAQKPRSGTLLRVFFGANLDPEDLAQLLDETEAGANRRLQTFGAIRTEISSDPLGEEHGRYWLATVSAGEHAARAQLAWVAETRATLLADRDDECGPVVGSDGDHASGRLRAPANL